MQSRLFKAASTMRAVKRFSTVAENSIKITFVDMEGNRATVPALIGRTLAEAAVRHNIDIEVPCGGGNTADIVHTEDWTEHQFKEGPTCFFCHVKIPSSYHHLFNPPSDKEVSGLWDTWDEEATATSRLACQIKLDKRMDGMTVFVVDAPVTF